MTSTVKVKGTWLASSLRGVRSHGRMDAYLARLPVEHHEVIRETVVSDWHPIAILMAHYAACDQLDVPPSEIVQLGVEATRHAHGGVLGMAARLAVGTAAVTPWTIAGQVQKLWDRIFIGGGVSVSKLGPKEARFDIAGFPCCRYRYCRTGMRGVVLGLTELFCTKAYVHEVPGAQTPNAAGFRVAWA
jgi:hypothetical protein